MKTSKTIIAGIAVLVVSLVGSSLMAETVTFKQGVSNALTGLYTGAEDVSIRTDYPDGNNGAGNCLGVQGYGGGTQENTLMRWDLSSLAGKTITGATLYVFGYDASGDQTVNVHAITAANKNWVEGTGPTWPPTAEAGSSCWNKKQYNGTDPDWAGSAGCSTGGTDYVGVPLASTLISKTLCDADQYFSWDLSGTAALAVLQGWVDAPADNSGLLLRSSQSYRTSLYSGDYNEDTRPYLVVDYVPEPATMTLLLLGLPFALKRRK